MVATVPRRRVAEESAERWQKALERAEGLRLYQCHDTGAWFVTGGSQDGVIYGPVDFDTCQCPAALAGDRVCRHRAAVRARFGLIERPAPAPEPVPFPGVNYLPCSLVTIRPVDATEAIDLTAVRCRSCHRGAQPCRDGSEVACVACGGSGWLPACPHCGGDGEVEVWSEFAGDHEAVPCRCAAVDAEPTSLAAD